MHSLMGCPWAGEHSLRTSSAVGVAERDQPELLEARAARSVAIARYWPPIASTAARRSAFGARGERGCADANAA